MNETNVFWETLEWLRRFSAVRHWVHDVFSLQYRWCSSTSRLWIEPGVCPKVEQMEGYFFSPFSLLFFLILQPLLSPFIHFLFFISYLGLSSSKLLVLSLGRSLRLWRIIGRLFLTLSHLIAPWLSYWCHNQTFWKSLKVFMIVKTYFVNTLRVLWFSERLPLNMCS